VPKVLLYDFLEVEVFVLHVSENVVIDPSKEIIITASETSCKYIHYWCRKDRLGIGGDIWRLDLPFVDELRVNL